jgi:hypothetical protein
VTITPPVLINIRRQSEAAAITCAYCPEVADSYWPQFDEGCGQFIKQNLLAAGLSIAKHRNPKQHPEVPHEHT